MPETKVKNESGCWYFIDYWSCPICGASETFRERRPPPKPKHKLGVTYDFHEDYACASQDVAWG